jgi:hypothetical protein
VLGAFAALPFLGPIGRTLARLVPDRVDAAAPATPLSTARI